MLAWLIVGLTSLAGIPLALWGRHEWRRSREAALVANAIMNHNQIELFRLLSERADLSAVHEWFGEPALILAVKSFPAGEGGGDSVAESVCVLMSHGADVNQQGTEWRTPLMYAASQGDLGLCALLLSRGADATAQDMLGRTAADWARLGGHERLPCIIRELQQ